LGKDVALGTDTKGYLVASGNAHLKLSGGGSISADKIMLIPDQNQSASFREITGLGKTISTWHFVSSTANTGIKEVSNIIKPK
jgi:hypothetical protein